MLNPYCPKQAACPRTRQPRVHAQPGRGVHRQLHRHAHLPTQRPTQRRRIVTHWGRQEVARDPLGWYTALTRTPPPASTPLGAPA
jgi:hypothetical protein